MNAIQKNKTKTNKIKEEKNKKNSLRALTEYTKEKNPCNQFHFILFDFIFLSLWAALVFVFHSIHHFKCWMTFGFLLFRVPVPMFISVYLYLFFIIVIATEHLTVYVCLCVLACSLRTHSIRELQNIFAML